MSDLKEILLRIRQTEQEKKKLREVFRDILAQSKSYQELLDQWKALKVKKIQLETALYSDCAKEREQVEKFTLSIKDDAQLLSDLALTKMMKGETIEITDDNDVKYEPVFKVSFKKAN